MKVTLDQPAQKLELIAQTLEAHQMTEAASQIRTQKASQGFHEGAIQAKEDMQTEALVSMRIEQFQLEQNLMADLGCRLQERLAYPSSKSEPVDFYTEIIDTASDFDSSPSKSLRITLNGQSSLSEVAIQQPCGHPGYNWATTSEAEMQGLIQDPRFKELLIFFTGKNYEFTFELYPQFNLADSSDVSSLDSVFKREVWKLLDEYEVVAEGDFWISTLNNFWVVQCDAKSHS